MSSLIPVFRHSFKDIVSEIPRTLVVTGNHRKGQVVVEISRDDGEAVRFLAMPEYNTLTVLEVKGHSISSRSARNLDLGNPKAALFTRKSKTLRLGYLAINTRMTNG